MVGFKPIEWQELDSKDEVYSVLVAGQVPVEDAQWLAGLLCSRDVFALEASGGTDEAFTGVRDFHDIVIAMAVHVCKLFSVNGGDRDAGLAATLQAFLVPSHRVGGPVDLPAARVLDEPGGTLEQWGQQLGLDLFLGVLQRLGGQQVESASTPGLAPWLRDYLNARGVDWGCGIRRIAQEEGEHLDRDFLFFLLANVQRADSRFLSKAINLTALRRPDCNMSALLASPDDRASVVFWLSVTRKFDPANHLVFRGLLPALVDEPDETAGHLAMNLAELIELTKPRDPKEAEAVISSLKPFWWDGLQLLDRRRDQMGERPTLRTAWYRYGVRTHKCGQTIPAEMGLALTNQAQRDLGTLRSLARDAGAAGADSRLDWPVRSAAAEFLFWVESPWKALKPLFLALSGLSVPSVAKDLRYWVDGDRERPPYPWCMIPNKIAMLVHSLRDEETKDPGLMELRSDMAAFCLERLRTKRQPDGPETATTPRNEDFVEDRPIWRYFYIRALQELKVNPRGRAHHVLHWVSKNDPDKDVRDAAAKAYNDLRHEQGLGEGLSPRRPLLAAFWWLRQAHLFHLGVEPDTQGAQRTRAKEVTRTEMQ